MKVNDVVLKLTAKFPRFLKDDANELKDIEESFKAFSESDLDRLWEEFRDTYTLVSPPRRAVFVQLASKLGIIRNVESKRYEFVCYICGARFNLDQTTCPKCGNHDKVWRAAIRVGGYHSGKLKEEIERERNIVREPVKSFNERGGRS